MAGTTLSLVAALVLAAPGPNAKDTVEVTFRCPGSGQLYRINWDSERTGSYFENGKSHDITFKGSGSAVIPSYSIESITRSGQNIRCEYRAATGSRALYNYTVNRQVIACSQAQSYALKCKLRDDEHK